jgi:putative drug exporter of the RND superfamily
LRFHAFGFFLFPKSIFGVSQYHLRKQFAALWVTRNWIGILVFWILTAVALSWVAPSLESVSQDGDLQFLPSSMPSRVGQRLLEDSFPGQQSKSRMVLIVARENTPLLNEDLAVAFDLGRRLNYFVAANILFQAQRLEPSEARRYSLEIAKGLLDISIQMDSNWFDLVKAVAPESTTLLENRWLASFDARADTIELLLSDYATETAIIGADASSTSPSEADASEPADASDDETAAARKSMIEKLREQVQSDRKTAALIRETQPEKPWSQSLTRDSLEAWQAIFDVWTWEDSLLGNKLGASHPSGRMIVLQLSNEFMAVDNVRLVQSLETLISDIRKMHDPIKREGLEVGVSGPAAIGADMVRAAGASVRQTEIISILMVLGILILIYRAPLLVLIPLLTIMLSLSVAISVVTLLSVQDSSWGAVVPGLKVFSTTKIFLVVLLFGMGTDFCLFLISRCREEILAKEETSKPIANRKAFQKVVAVGWVGVFDALVGSALTTATGLAMMYFSAFEKFRYNGIVIAISILVTLLVCLTFTPALLCAFGRFAFWPMKLFSSNSRSGKKEQSKLSSEGAKKNVAIGFWGWLAKTVIYAPVTTLVITVALLCVPAYQGWVHGGNVTYDFLTELNETAPSRRGTELIERFFTTRDNSPLTLVVVAENPFNDVEELTNAVERLGNQLYLDGVISVRSISDPLGDYPPEKRMGLFDPNAWRRRLLKNHRITTTYFASPQEDQTLKTARMDLLLKPNPFSAEAEAVLANVRDTITREVSESSSPWFKATFAYTGTTAGIADLKKVTQADQFRIQWMVTLGVGAILFGILRRPVLSIYLMLTVLLSYFSTLGLTHWFFALIYGADFVGLDWKVPLLLFVILVAVGQDYNVYLVTRVFEEQAKRGMVEGLYRGIVATGGIITSCGLVMAATFFSMTMAGVIPWFSELVLGGAGEAWEQPLVLRGILELGFALGLGVLIDTFLVRTILVPAMMSWMIRFQK